MLDLLIQVNSRAALAIRRSRFGGLAAYGLKGVDSQMLARHLLLDQTLRGLVMNFLRAFHFLARPTRSDRFMRSYWPLTNNNDDRKKFKDNRL